MTNYPQLAKELRRTVISMTNRAKSSHIGSNFSSADLLTVIYDIADMSKDIVLVKPWNIANVYACLVRKGLLPQEAVDDYGKEGTPWTTIGEPIPPYIPFSTGAMGYNLPAAVGFALAKKLKGEEGTVYCLISDGELNIGSTWESLAIAKHHKLDNLVLIVDKNGLSAMGATEDILDMEPVEEKLVSFGAFCVTIDGHNHETIYKSLGLRLEGKPIAIVANTVKGKGFSKFENNNLFHYSHVNSQILEEALKEIDAQ